MWGTLFQKIRFDRLLLIPIIKLDINLKFPDTKLKKKYANF